MGAAAVAGALVIPGGRKIFPMYSRTWTLRAHTIDRYLEFSGSRRQIEEIAKRIQGLERRRLDAVAAEAELRGCRLVATRKRTFLPNIRDDGIRTFVTGVEDICYGSKVEPDPILWHFGPDIWEKPDCNSRTITLLGHPYAHQQLTELGLT